jgi:hypothetical protein
MELSEIEKTFLIKYGIDEEKIFDATGLSKAKYNDEMEGSNFLVAAGVSPCNRGGHKLRTRHGHCAICNPENLNYKKRFSESANVYIAYSVKIDLIKIGYCTSIDERQKQLQSEKYGNTSDWSIVASVYVKNAGAVESSLHSALRDKRVTKKYFKNGSDISASELFKCDINYAKKLLIEKSGNALNEVIKNQSVSELNQVVIKAPPHIIKTSKKSSNISKIGKLFNSIKESDRLRDYYFSLSYDRLLSIWNKGKNDFDSDEKVIIRAAMTNKIQTQETQLTDKAETAPNSRSILQINSTQEGTIEQQTNIKISESLISNNQLENEESKDSFDLALSEALIKTRDKHKRYYRLLHDLESLLKDDPTVRSRLERSITEVLERSAELQRGNEIIEQKAKERLLDEVLKTSASIDEGVKAGLIKLRDDVAKSRRLLEFAEQRDERYIRYLNRHIKANNKLILEDSPEALELVQENELIKSLLVEKNRLKNDN